MAIWVSLLVLSALAALSESSPINSLASRVIFEDDRITLKSLRTDEWRTVFQIQGPKTERQWTKCPADTIEETCWESQDFKLNILTRDFCHTFALQSVEPVDEELRIFTELNYTHLYGGPEQFHQYWPLDDVKFDEYSMVTKMQDNQGIADGYWLTSDGMCIYVHPENSLFLEQNIQGDHYIKLISVNKPPYHSPAILKLQYSVCSSENAREAHMQCVKHYIGKPTGIPDERMITHPIWSTWAKYKVNIDEDVVMEFADEILDHGFSNSQLEIDDLWETCYGSFEFDKSKFPNMKELGTKLKEKGFRVTVWIHPFINIDCEPYYSDAQRQGYLVKDSDGNTETEWWNGKAGVVDFTNEEAVEWWSNRLKTLQRDEGIDSFKFDAGETSWMPQVPDLNADTLIQPTIFTMNYVEAVSKFGDLVEVRVGHNTQQHPIFVRMLDKDSRWDMENGLPTLITTLLEMNLVGYPLVLPDMVGGNGYGSDAVDKQLFIRWLQANVFMPSIQYSYVPWDFDEETVAISKKFTQLHVDYAPKIIELMKKAVEDGSPVNPPVWWIDPLNPEAQEIKDEFLLGEDILVAPVIEKDAESRDVFLPKGSWKDMNDPNGNIIEGSQWIRNYPAPLGTLPYFERQ